MRSIFVLGAHRAACLALYKSFLRQCHRLPSKTLQRITTAVVRREFKRNKCEQDKKKLTELLVAAYKDEAFLRIAAAGDKSTIESLHQRLSKYMKVKAPNPPQPKQPPMKTSTTLTRKEKEAIRKQHLKEERKAQRLVKQAELHASSSSSPSLSDSSPLTSIPNFPQPIHPNRHLYKRLYQPATFLTPIAATANSFPLLRVRGEMTPEWIAMTIKNKIRLRQKRHDYKDLMEEYLTYAEGEDIFDEEVAKFSALPLTPPGMRPGETAVDKSWEANNEEVSFYLKAIVRKTEYRNREMADRFLKIVKKAEAKKEEIKKLRVRARRKRKKQVVLQRQLWIKKHQNNPNP